MKSIRGIKALVLLFLSLVCLGLYANVVHADYDFRVGVRDSERRYGYLENDGDERFGVKFDKTNNTIILNGVDLNDLELYCYGEDESDPNYSKNINKRLEVKIKLVGNNTITNGYILNYESSNITFTGTGTLNFVDSYIENRNYRSRLTFDGPTIKYSGKNKFIDWPGEVVVKRGTVSANYNVELSTSVNSYDETKYHFSAESLIDAGRLELLGGKLDLSYKITSAYDEKIAIDDRISKKYVIDTSEVPFCINEKNKDFIKITIPKPIKNFFYNSRTLEVSLYLSTASGDNFYLVSNNPEPSENTKHINSVKGLSWDEESRTLTMNGYNGPQFEIYCNYNTDIKVKVLGNNTIKWVKTNLYNNYDYYGIEIGNSALVFNGGDYEFIGNGTLNLYTVVDDVFGIYSKTVGTNDNKVNFTLNGASINIYAHSYQAIKVGGFEMKSGRLNIYRDFNEMSKVDSSIKTIYAAISVEGKIFKIHGGTVVLSYKNQMDKDKDYSFESPFYGYIPRYTGNDIKEMDVLIENCVVVLAGQKEVTEGIELCTFQSENALYGKNVHVLYADSLNNVPKVNINKFKASLSQKEFFYDGKAKKPVVKVGGLVEGTDYTVKYSNNIKVGTATVTVTGKGLYNGTVKLSFSIKKSKKTYGPKKGTKLKDKTFKYKVLKSASSDKTVIGKLSVTGLVKKNKKKITLKSKVVIDGYEYKVTSIGKKAFAKCKKLKKVTLCKGITKIGKKAFAGKANKKLVIVVPKKKYKKYKKLLKKAKCANYTIKKK